MGVANNYSSHGGRTPCFHGWDVTISQCPSKGGGPRKQAHKTVQSEREREKEGKRDKERFGGSLCRIAVSGGEVGEKWRLSKVVRAV
jgi:hypothetical protein